MKRFLRVLTWTPRFVREPIIRRLVKFDPARLTEIVVKRANTSAEFYGAARILHDTYVERGLYTAPHPSGLRTTPALVLPSTATLVAKRGAQVVGAISLIPDSPLGLPIEDMYPEEVRTLRQQGRRLAEVAALCLIKEYRRTGLTFLLNKAAWRHALASGFDDLLMFVPLRGVDFYRATLASEILGPPRPFAGVQRREIIRSLRLNLNTMHDVWERRFGRYGKTPRNTFYMYFEAEHPQIEPPPESIGSEATDAIADLIAARTDVFKTLSTEKIAYLRSVLHPHSVRALEHGLEGGVVRSDTSTAARGD